MRFEENDAKKRIIIAIFSVLVLIAVLCGFLAFQSPERRISRFVTENQADLEQLAAECLEGGTVPDSYQDVRVDGVFSGDERIVQFFYNGFGLAPASKYYGFYYAESGEPAAYQNTDYPLTETEDGWSWSAGGTDNGGLTRRITGNWFYYEAWF